MSVLSASGTDRGRVCFTALRNRLWHLYQPSASTLASGRGPPSTSITTSPSMETFTVCRTLWCSMSWKSAPRRPRWRSSTRAIGSLPTCAVAGAAKPSPRTSTAQESSSPSGMAAIVDGELGAQHRSPHGPVVRANPERESPRKWATAPVWASFAWRSSIRHNARRPRRNGHSSLRLAAIRA